MKTILRQIKKQCFTSSDCSIIRVIIVCNFSTNLDIFFTCKSGQPVKKIIPGTNRLKRQPYKMVKHTQTIRWQKSPNCLSVFDPFVSWRLTLDPLCGFSKTVFSREGVKPWFFVTFNIIIRHILENPENPGTS